MRRKTNAQKVTEGNPGRRPITADPDSIKGMPAQPPILRGEALAEWRRMISLLDKAGILTTIDGAALTMYCLSWARYVQAEQKLHEQGPVFEANGFLRLSPWAKISDEAAKQCRALLIEFGFTPASRHRVDIQTTITPEADEFSQFVASRNVG
ncbi:phage terminase small subunit P27 family [Anatilimnocola floriformis]|uniref:phage terminase small subunit P27 family n=1 Tax=Anatilimnocola floriformis TaxID=2948575 RepID=UPI0020C42A4C|nr:phage terminase small subunit P27 family [Anatilimnocola floriformis]